MSSTIDSERVLFAWVLALFVCRAVLAAAIVPPWQGPDEPGQFFVTQLLSLPYRTAERMQPQMERAVIESMARHRWWELYGEQRPDPLPSQLSDPRARRIQTPPVAQPLYYGLGAFALRLAPASTVDAAYWRLRALSIVLAVATLVVGWAGTRLMFGPAIAIGAASIAALHPQFVLSAVTVNPDALVIFIGAAMWWLVGRVCTQRQPVMSVLLIAVLAVAVLLTKRSAIPAAFVAIGSAALLLLGQMWRLRRLAVVWLALCLVTAGAIVGVIWTSFRGPFSYLGTYWSLATPIYRVFNASTAFDAVRYAGVTLDHLWLTGGWGRFPAPEPWSWTARVLTVAGLVAAASLLSRRSDIRRPLVIAWLIVAVHAGSIITWGFLSYSVAQGRYLFPVMAPATALLWMGWTRLTPAAFRPYAAPAIVVVLAVLDVAGFATVLIPAYLR